MWMRPTRRMMSAACRPPASAEAKRESPARPAPPAQPAAAIPLDIIDTALASGSFKTLLSAVIRSELGATLKDSGPFTVFAPSDTAFGKLPAGTMEDLLKPENREQLRAILTFHVVSGGLTAADLVNTRSLTTANGRNCLCASTFPDLPGQSCGVRFGWVTQALQPRTSHARMESFT